MLESLRKTSSFKCYRVLQNRITAGESVGAIHESPVQALANLHHIDDAYRRVRDAARYERVHTAGGKVAAPTK